MDKTQIMFGFVGDFCDSHFNIQMWLLSASRN